ncbi:hypothetical protein L3Q82_022675 [Scortum barcoo]|uniref:Uncharacterized protein n=1 Tax=Scortum barcoo TaxID=214431 RepID=A0ACB8WX37_9TELE|nr:hypothetical protein L3Q82_022675 [Scortum barcoo]
MPRWGVSLLHQLLANLRLLGVHGCLVQIGSMVSEKGFRNLSSAGYVLRQPILSIFQGLPFTTCATSQKLRTFCPKGMLKNESMHLAGLFDEATLAPAGHKQTGSTETGLKQAGLCFWIAVSPAGTVSANNRASLGRLIQVQPRTKPSSGRCGVDPGVVFPGYMKT